VKNWSNPRKRASGGCTQMGKSRRWSCGEWPWAAGARTKRKTAAIPQALCQARL